MSAPRILFPTRLETRKDLPIQFAHQAHLDALLEVGALPVLVPALGLTLDVLDTYLADADGLLLAEGGDIAPQDPDAPDADEYLDIDAEKDSVEFALAEYAVRAGLPTLATCRGAQVINVVAGGTLHTHLPRDLGTSVIHVDQDNYDGLRHGVDIREGSPLQVIYRSAKVSVTSVHHQGVRNLAPEFLADAHAPDGLIEAFHAPNHPFLLCVQYHPERQFPEQPGHLGLYAALIEAARRHAEQRTETTEKTPVSTGAGYSGTPLPKKLGIKPGHTVGLIDEPDRFREILDPLPKDVVFRTSARGRLDVIVAFFTARADYERRLASMSRAIFPDGGIWIAWPKRASKVPTDMTEDVVREVALPTGLVDNKVCAIDETWSGLRVVHRRELRR